MNATRSNMDGLRDPRPEQARAIYSGDYDAARKTFDRMRRPRPKAGDRTGLHGADLSIRIAGAGGGPGGIDPEDFIFTDTSLMLRAAIAWEVQEAEAAIPRGEMQVGTVDVADLLAKLDGSPASASLPTCSVSGAFFPSILLYEGWWNKAKTGAAAWGADAANEDAGNRFQNIQSWLNRGFEQWGPSFNLVAPGETETDLFAQLGYGDEANSLPVVVGPMKARVALDALGRSLVMRAKVQGALCHRDHLATHFTGRSQAIAKRLVTANPQYQHFLLVQDDNPDHKVEPDKQKPSLYSAYLWQCLARKEDEESARNGLLPLRKTIFLWEHTNLADPDSVKFNFDSLMSKKRYLENTVGTGALSVLHHSYPVHHVIGGDTVAPLVSTATMMDLFSRTRDLFAEG